MATTTTTTAESTIKKVVVYSDRAQIFRTGTVQGLAAGDHTITFNGLWSHVNRDTLQVASTPVKGGGASVILRGVQFTTVQEVVDVRPQRREIDEKLHALVEPTQAAQDEIDLCNRARANLTKLKSKLTTQMQNSERGSPFVYDAKLWAEFNDFIRSSNEAQRSTQREAEKKHKELEKQKHDLEAERRRLGSADEKRTSREVAEVTLTVATAKPDATIDLELMLSYLVRGCSWKATYDLRIDKASKKMGVTYNAIVKQNAGEDWKDVRLELSTAKAHVGGEIPDFDSPWYLRKRQPQHFFSGEADGFGGGAQMQQMMPNMMMQQMMTNVMPVPPPGAGGGGGAAARHRTAAEGFAAAASTAASVSSSSTSVAFVIAALSTVPASNEPVKVSVAIFDLPIFLRYSVVPKLDSNCYLKVKATHESDFPMLAGACNVFCDEQLISRTEMDDVAPGEEFWTFLGVDSGMSCKRKELSKKNVAIKGGMFSADKTRIEYSYKFTCKNTKSTTEELVVWDQLPISDDSRIVVTQIQPKPDDEGKEPKSAADAPLFKTNDVKFIEWFVDLKPMEEKIFNLEFHVEHPTEHRITI